MAMDTLTSMAVFRQVVDRGTIVAAARATGLSAEMAGHHLRSLETRLGIRLLYRTTRRLSLTEAGRAYYDRCVAVLDEVAIAEAEAAQLQTDPRGHLKIAAPLAFGRSALVAPLAAFTQKYPEVSIDLDLSERNVQLVDEHYDLALRLGDLPDSSLVARRLADFPLMLVASPDYLAGASALDHPADVGSHEALIYTQTGNPRLWQFVDGAGKSVAVTTAGRIAASDVEFLLQLALQGRGLLQVPAFLLGDYLATGRLVQLLPTWRTRVLPLHVVLPHRSLLPATVRRFTDFLADWFHRAP